MKEIGGYFELELQFKEEYHKKALKLNSGRNCFKYILETQRVTKVYIPNFICNSLIEPLKILNILYEFYNIDKYFEIIDEIILKENEKILYVNYFSCKSKYIQRLVSCYGEKLIIDNTPAFFELPIKHIDTIYSPRKFFGVSDGGYLYTTQLSDKVFENDLNANYSQLIGRIQSGASSYYENFQRAEQRLINLPINLMSNFTSKILNSIDYEDVKIKRARNFLFLHNELKHFNELNTTLIDIKVPFVYPYLIDNQKLRNELIKNKIYVAKYWNEVFGRQTVTNLERHFVEHIIPLPIDQRYDLEDMKRIVEVIKGCK